MDNSTIAANFSLLAQLMDIHGENSFKTRSYATAAYTIEKLPVALSKLAPEKLFSIKGIGDAIGKKIQEQLGTGQLSLLNEYLANTPAGVVEMLHIKGLGPKKIATVWKELEIEHIGELLYACNENRLLLYKGFGAKTQLNIKESIEFYLNNQGNYLYAQVEAYALRFTTALQKQFAQEQTHLSGDFRRQLEVIHQLEWVTTIAPEALQAYLTQNGYNYLSLVNELATYKGKDNETLQFRHSTPANFYYQLFRNSCSTAFLDEWHRRHPLDTAAVFTSEEAIFEKAGMAFVPPCLREQAGIFAPVVAAQLPHLIQPGDITGIIHSHSKWSDGANTVEEMALAAKAKGLQYLVLSDHSRSAFYANGLSIERLLAQHAEIDALNERLAPFKIFKSIESDILNDGSLDYPLEILQQFDLLIASVHSNLKMTEEKAMMRLLRAIENPFTSILGHLTGRLLLSRSGYPVNHHAIIDACAKHQVVIELNAHPRRLDIDWRWIPYALEKNVLLSINPDAHALDGFADTRYGVLTAQKAGLTKRQNLSSFSLPELEAFIQQQQLKRK